MRTARAKISVDIMLVTAPMTIAGKSLRQGDLLVSDGVNTWGVAFEDVAMRLAPTGEMANAIMGEAARLVAARPKFDPKEIAT